MPLVPLALLLLLPLVFVVLLPFSIVLRYRAGTARRVGRSWVARLNVGGISLSALLFVFGAALMSAWVPSALLYSLAGLAGGAILGLLGLRLTHWEPNTRGLYFTPFRPLVLLITIGVAARVLYGIWRAWHSWQSAGPGDSWLAASGVAGSIAVGGIVLGYYLVYWTGVGRRLKARGRLQVTRER